MKTTSYFYQCSKDYIDSISDSLYFDVIDAIETLPRRKTQAELNYDLFMNLVNKSWSFDSLSSEAKIENSIEIKRNNDRKLCLTSQTLNAGWHSDFAKQFGHDLVQMEVQFGKVEAMFKDFCGFRIAYFEKRITLGIEIIMLEPTVFFSHRKAAISGMAYFEIARDTLPAISLDCPIWLIGIS